MVPLRRQSVTRPEKLDMLKAKKGAPKERKWTERELAKEHFGPPANPGKFEFSVYAEPEVKAALVQLTRGKCAYCEHHYDAGQPGDVEHYRPKGRIDTPNGKLGGYWWLASDWDNLLPSCIRCNREEKLKLYDNTTMLMGKGDRFPIDDEAARATAEGGHVHETPLLLNPCDHDPRRFIRFVDDEKNVSLVEPKEDETTLEGRRGRKSIDTYGLNRETLVRDRSRELVIIKMSIENLSALVLRLDEGGPGQALIEDQIEVEFQRLELFRSEEGQYTAMARTLIDPILIRLGKREEPPGGLLEYLLD